MDLEMPKLIHFSSKASFSSLSSSLLEFRVLDRVLDELDPDLPETCGLGKFEGANWGKSVKFKVITF